jgi:H+/Cl- antiporter ClcA
VEAKAMSKDPRVTFVLILAGIGCIIASIAAVTFLYHQHAAEFSQNSNRPEEHFIPFILFVGLPSLAGFIVGAVLLFIGIRRDKAS